MNRLTHRERLRRCYFHEELDRPAVYSRTGFPKDDPTYDRLKAYLGEHAELKHTWNSAVLEAEYPIDISFEPHSDDFQRRIEILHTPKGDLRRTFLASRKGQPGMHETFFVKCAEDVEKYLSLEPPVIGGDLSDFFKADAAMGDTGIVDVLLRRNPGGFVVELCGSEQFAEFSVTDRELMHQLCQRQMQIVIDNVKFLLSRGVGPFFSMLGEEYLVPPLHGPKDFYDFNVQYDKPIVDLIHDAGGRIHVHSHGSIKRVFQGFVDMGVDVLHPFEPPPQGDILPKEAKALARGKMCLEGNIQIQRLYENGPEEIRQETQQLIADVFDDRKGLIVSPSASPYIRGMGEVCFPQYKAMVDTVVGFNAK